MFDRWLGIPAHLYLHLTGALLIAIGLPLNKVVMSIGSIWVISNVVLEADFKTYFQRLQSNPLFWVILALFVLHFVGLIWSTDLDYAIRDIKNKLPFLTIPLALFAKPLPKQHVRIVLVGFVASTVITSLINALVFYQSGHFTDGTDVREMSLFGSHIRYGLIVLFAMMTCVYFAINNFKLRLLSFLLASWLLFYMFIAQVLSANFAMIILLIGMSLYVLLNLKSKSLRWAALSLFTFIIVSLSIGIWNLFQPNSDTFNFSNLPEKTTLGNPYYHDTTNRSTENGHHIMSYIQEDELRVRWNRVSAIPYDEGVDQKGQAIMGTLIRFMTSKGLTKDDDGFNSLTEHDIQLVEKGIPSILYTQRTIFSRYDGLKLQIQNYYSGGTSSGHSLLQRLEHWRAASLIIRENWVIGVGTGDIQQAFLDAYDKLESDLPIEKQNRAHNQFMTFWATFGIIGFILFLLFNYYLFKISIQQKSWLALSFALIALSSFLPEDTLETQQGVTFIALFTGLLPILGKPSD